MKARHKRQIQLYGRILFAVYLVLLLYFLFFAEQYGRVNGVDAGYRYNLVLFKEIRRFWTYREQLGMKAVILNLLGNVIGFMPFGFFLPMISRKRPSIPVTTLLGFLFSFVVECLQLAGKVGSFDVDDLLLNTLGALLGALLFWFGNRIRRMLDRHVPAGTAAKRSKI